MSATDRHRRPTYSPEQLKQYFDRIGLPQKYQESAIIRKHESPDSETGLALLKTMQRYHLAAAPFENISLHYSTHRHISIEPHALFDKIVKRNAGRGGYCMENNGLFGTVLRSLGYDVYSVGARVNEAAEHTAASKNWTGFRFNGWGHMVNIVTIRGRQYLVDVGFGSNGSHQPFLLEHGIESSNYGGQSIRLVFEPIAQNLNQSQRLWQYERRNAPDESWIPTYCFTETEFLPDDFVILNYFTSTSRESWFTFNLVCVKMLLDPDREEIIGDLTLFNNQLKRRIGATSEVLATFASDNERVAGLEKYFGVILDQSEREGIRRTITEIL